MSDEFAWHSAALAGTRGPISADEPMSGWYRQKSREGIYEPVAYWKDSQTGAQRCHINGKEPRDPLRGFEVWPHASRYPISAEAYWHRMDTGAWLDDDAGAAAAAKGPDIDPATDPVGSMRAEIEKARAGLPNYAAIDSDEQAARAQTLRSALTALSGKAEKARKAAKEPHIEAGKKIDALWMPLTNDAQAGADTIRRALIAWETIKLENQRRAEKQTAEMHAEAAKHPLADVAGPMPIIVPNTPPPAMQIKGASGRAAPVGVRKVVKSIDLDKCYAQFGGLPEVYNLFMALAQKAVDAGRDVPGAEIKEEATVK